MKLIQAGNEYFTMTCDIVNMGEDVQICIYGGDKAHIGSVVLSEPRESLTGKGIGVTSSVMNRIGHKDEAVARMIAEEMAKYWNRVVCVSCGFHIDHAAPEQIACVMELAENLLNKIKHAN